MNSSSFSLAVLRLLSCDLLLPNWSCGFGKIPMATSDWNKRLRMTHLMSEIGGKDTHATCYNIDATTVDDLFECLPSIFQRWQALSRSWSSMSPTLCRSPHLGDVGVGDEHCDALLFLDCDFKLFHCFFEIVESLFVAFAALIQSAFIEGALSSSREPRGVEERDFFLISSLCSSA